MEWQRLTGSNEGDLAGQHGHESAHAHEPKSGQDDMLATAATVAVVGAGVLVFEAALLPGLVLGVATMLVPKQLPRIGAMVTPIMKSTVRGMYALGQKTKDMFAEVQEQVHDIVAEVDAEGKKATKSPAQRADPTPSA